MSRIVEELIKGKLHHSLKREGKWKHLESGERCVISKINNCPSIQPLSTVSKDMDD